MSAPVTANVSVHQTLTISTVDQVTLTGYGRYIQFIHRGTATNPIYVTLGKTPATPVAGAAETYVFTSAVPIVLPWPADVGQGSCVVKLISAGAEPYSVQVIGDRNG